jgi:hypothetical protein
MAATLQDILLTPENRPQVEADCYQLLHQEIHDLSGVSGTAVKVAYSAVTTFSPGHVRYMVEQLLPGMTEKLEPYWADFGTSGGSEFGDYLAKRSDEVSESLLEVTDQRALGSDHPAIVKAYRAVRGGAAKHVGAALPRIGAMVQKHMS